MWSVYSSYLLCLLIITMSLALEWSGKRCIANHTLTITHLILLVTYQFPHYNAAHWHLSIIPPYLHPIPITLTLSQYIVHSTLTWYTIVNYYHWASFANLVAVASNIEIFPQLKLWYFFNMPKNVYWILLRFWMTCGWYKILDSECKMQLCTILHVIRYLEHASISEY